MKKIDVRVEEKKGTSFLIPGDLVYLRTEEANRDDGQEGGRVYVLRLGRLGPSRR